MTIRDKFASLIRTGVPYLVGLFLAWLARKYDIVLDGAVSADLAGWAVFLVGTAYYAVIRWAETRWRWVGWFLGLAKPPTYPELPPAR